MEFNFGKYTVILVVLSLFSFSGCGQQQKQSGSIAANGNRQANSISIYSEYSPEKVHILPLTEFVMNKSTNQGEINLFVSLLDSFGYQIKSPCVFRFELYLRIQRSSEPKGQRLMIWTDVDLIQPQVNNEYWRDFLRAYEFNLPFEPQKGQSYILEVTCLCPNNKRLASEFMLKTENES